MQPALKCAACSEVCSLLSSLHWSVQPVLKAADYPMESAALLNIMISGLVFHDCRQEY